MLNISSLAIKHCLAQACYFKPISKKVKII